MNAFDLKKILKSKIFLHTNGQLHVAHVIFGYTPISTHFQSPKNVIKTRDPYLARIDIAVEGFIRLPPLAKTLRVDLIAQ